MEYQGPCLKHCCRKKLLFVFIIFITGLIFTACYYYYSKYKVEKEKEEKEETSYKPIFYLNK